jgi:tripartite-type tricarboxylate transporter receptor subunit TctC
VPRFEAQSWVGVLAPAGTPRPVVARLNEVLRQAVAQQDARERFAQQGYEIVGSTPEQFGAWLKSESDKWGKIIRERGITAE